MSYSREWSHTITTMATLRGIWSWFCNSKREPVAYIGFQVNIDITKSGLQKSQHQFKDGRLPVKLDGGWILKVTSMLVMDVGDEMFGDYFEMLVTVLAILVTKIHYLFILALGNNIQTVSPTSTFCHQHQKIVTNITVTILNEVIISFKTLLMKRSLRWRHQYKSMAVTVIQLNENHRCVQWRALFTVKLGL